MTINLKSLPPAVPGQDYARTLQGNTPAGIAATGFLPTDTLSATVSLEQNLPALFTVTPSWSNSALCQFVLSIPAAQTALLAIDSSYYGLVSATRAGTTYPIAAFYLPTLPVPGAQAAAAPPDLASIPYVLRLLAMLALTEPQFEMVPTLITSASDAIRSWCNRRFDQGILVEEVPVIRGIVRLARPPINFIQRIQSRPRVALTVSNLAAQAAWVDVATTGDVAGGLAITGMILNAISGGVTTPITITYTANQTIASLAAAINSVGSGWSATSDLILGAWPVTEISDGLASKGAGANDRTGAQFHVYSENVTGARFDEDDGQRTGMVWVGQRGGSIDWTWGPDAALFAGGAAGADRGSVKVTYNGGFATVPPEVQDACAHLVKHEIEQFRTPLLLTSERAGEYGYTISSQAVGALPQRVLQKLSRYRLTNA